MIVGIIPCAEKCAYQKDGYCFLESAGKINSVNSVCPYYKSADKVYGVLKTSYGDEFKSVGDAGDTFNTTFRQDTLGKS